MQQATAATLLDGKAVAEKIVAEIAEQLNHSSAIQPTLATILIGNYPPSRLYVGLKRKMAARAGIKTHLIELPADIAQQELEETITRLANDETIHGILMQLPLPEHLDTYALIEHIPPHKDVDGLTSQNLGQLLNNKEGLTPCTPLGVMELIQHYRIPTQGKKAIIIGRSSLVSLPLAILLSRKGIDCTTTICHSRTTALAQECRQADILIAACGSPEIVTADFVKTGAAVFDVGVTRKENKIIGDVQFETVSPIAAAITPMPGGTGPMTVACLLKNTVRAAMMQTRHQT